MNEQNQPMQAQSQGQTGTLTQGHATNQATISDTDFNELNHARRRNGAAPADGYLSVMLSTRAGWTPEMTANFLGLHEATVQAWLSNYRQGGIDALRGLAPPSVRGT